MWRVARKLGDHYSILTQREALTGGHEGERVDCPDRYFTRHLLRWLADDLALSTYRRIVGEQTGVRLRDCGNNEVIEHLADLLVGRRLVLQRRSPPRPHLSPVLPEAAPQRPPARAAKRPDSWIELRIVDDESGDPFAGVELKVTASDGSISRASSDRDGGAWMDHIVGGACSASSPRKKGEGTALDTAAFLGIGEAPTGKKEASDEVQTAGKEVAGAEAGGGEPSSGQTGRAPVVRRARHIARITEHKVKSGDTLEQLAESVNLTAEELARFNWGAAEPEEIEGCLGAFVGCTRRDEKGRYLLDDSDNPGIVYLPEPWEQGGLATEQKHTIRVKLVRTWVRMLYQLDVDEPAAKDDTIIIRTDDGSWTYEIPVSSLSEVEPDWVELVFPRPPPGRRYSMIQDLGKDGDPIVIVDGHDESVFWASDPDEVELWKPGEEEQGGEDSDEEPEPDPDEEWDDEPEEGAS